MLPDNMQVPQLICDQDYGFDYSDGDDGDEGGSADVENMYYTAKCASCHAPLRFWADFDISSQRG